jgi:integrase
VKVPKVNNVLVRYLSADQELMLISFLPEKYRHLVIMALNTGLCQGELLRLAWADVDWNSGILTVHETKAGERRRTPMNSTVVGLLSTIKTTSLSDRADRVFPFDARYVRRVFDAAVKATGLSPFQIS